MFTVEICTVVMLAVCIWIVTGETAQGSLVYNSIVFFILLLTLLFANFAEAIAEAEYSKACYELWQENRLKKQRETVNYLNKQKYFKIAYIGNINLVTYLEITKAYLESGVVMFDGITSKMSNRSVVNEPNGINIETQRIETYKRWDNFVTGSTELETVTELTKEQYESFLTAVNNLYNI